MGLFGPKRSGASSPASLREVSAPPGLYDLVGGNEPLWSPWVGMVPSQIEYPSHSPAESAGSTTKWKIQGPSLPAMRNVHVPCLSKSG
jgi:hypothetical protein